MFRNSSPLAALSAAMLLSAPAAIASVEAVSLEPLTFAPAELVIVSDDGRETVYDPAALEALPTYRMETTTPWRAEPAVFEGVLLSDLLAAHGLADNAAVRVLAENEYETVVENAVWTSTHVLVATRVDGAPHTRRERGPIQFVVHSEDYYAKPVLGERHLVWMVARIEPLN